MDEGRLFSRRLVPVLAAGIALLLVASVAAVIYGQGFDGGRLGKLRSFVAVNDEANLPTWFSAALLGSCAAITWLIGTAERQLRGARWKHWYGLTAIFLCLSLDEAGRLHERFIDPIRDLLGATGLFFYAWIVVAIPAAVLMAITYAGFARELPRVAATRLVGAGALYVVAAVGVEAISAAYRDANGPGVGFSLLSCLEEGLEMAAVLLALTGFGAYAAQRFQSARLSWRDDGSLQMKVLPNDR